MFRSLVATWFVLWAATATAADVAPRTARPTQEPWSDGPTLTFKTRVWSALRQGADPRLWQVRVGARRNSLLAGRADSISVNEDLLRFIGDAGGGVLAQLDEATHGDASPRPRSDNLSRAALASRERTKQLLADAGHHGDDVDRIAETMLWRGLAYGSSTVTHGSDSFEGASNGDAQRRARAGLSAAVGRSFALGERVARAVATGGSGRVIGWHDVEELHRVAVEGFPEKQPGRVRHVNFAWPVNPFGVNWPRLHGDDGEVGRFGRALDATTADDFAARPLDLMARSLGFVHNRHPFLDGNGRSEVLVGWGLARGAGFPVPLAYDQASSEFKLAATKWGGTEEDLRDFLARGALRSERYVRDLLRVLGPRRIRSTHTDQGAVGALVEPRAGGARSLLVMLPVTHAAAWDPELARERHNGRAVLVGGAFDPDHLRLEVAVDGKHNTWQSIAPTKVHRWARRYPWWTTVEPIFEVPLPPGATYANFRVRGPDGQQTGAADYFLPFGAP